MLNEIIQLLKVTPYGVSGNIDFAKGKLKYPKTWQEYKNQARWRKLEKSKLK